MTISTPDTAAQELAKRLHRVRGGLTTDLSGTPSTREQVWANEFITDLLAAGWHHTPPEEQ